MARDADDQVSAAVLTPAGRGAVAVIRVQGNLDWLESHGGSLFHAVSGRPWAQQPLGRIAYGRWGGEHATGEDVIVCRVDPNVLEIHCHGGDAAVRRILRDLELAGLRVEPWHRQFTQTAGSLAADTAEALSRATTWRTAEILNEQLGGLMRGAVLELCRSLRKGASTAAAAGLAELRAWSDFGLHLSEPWIVVLTGRPNVGKSTLINALLGYQRAIVFDQPGTTRDIVTGETAFDGWPVLLVDTAGLRESHDELEAAGIALARQQLESADARLVLIDLSQPPHPEDIELISRWPGAIVIGHKCDREDTWGSQLPAGAVQASSVTGQGLDEIQHRLVRQLVPRVPRPGTAIPISRRQVDLLNRADMEIAAGRRDQCLRVLECLLESPP